MYSTSAVIAFWFHTTNCFHFLFLVMMIRKLFRVEEGLVCKLCNWIRLRWKGLWHEDVFIVEILTIPTLINLSKFTRKSHFKIYIRLNMTLTHSFSFTTHKTKINSHLNENSTCDVRKCISLNMKFVLVKDRMVLIKWIHDTTTSSRL
jgi:hypothetical protein